MRDVSPERGRARHDFPEVGVQLRCAARDVERGNARPLEKGETRLEDRAWHLLDAIRPGVHVAVAAGLVASLPDRGLEDLDRGWAERGQGGDTQPACATASAMSDFSRAVNAPSLNTAPYQSKNFLASSRAPRSISPKRGRSWW